MAAYGLRQIGVTAHALGRRHAFDYPAQLDIVPGPSRASWLRTAGRAIRGHDLLHMYIGQTFLPESAHAVDIRAAQAFGRQAVVEFCGTEARIPSLESARNPHYVAGPADRDEPVVQRLERWARVTNGHAIVNDRALRLHVATAFEHVHVAPVRVDTRRFVPAFPKREQAVPRLVHCPSNLRAKGTSVVRAAVDELRGGGLPFDYVEIHGRSNADTLAATATADLVIDQLRLGAHGVFAAEAWSLGKPVVCNIGADVLPDYPEGFPAINASPIDLASVLERWLTDGSARHERGRASREYVERVHDCRVVARELVDIYDDLPR